MIVENPKHEQVLAQINQEFSAYRQQQTGRPRYPSALKDLVKSACKAGIKPARIATAAGVPRITLKEWNKPKRKPRELEIVDAPASERAMVGELARIYLCSGISIELPVSALRRDLLNTLEGGF